MPKTVTKRVETPPQFPVIGDAAHQVWLAGLGALSIAGDESGRIFRTLVKRGEAFENVAADRWDDVRERLDVRRAAVNAVDRLSDGFDEGMTDVLHRLGLPTKKEIDGLTRRVERLTRALEEKPARPRRAAAKRRTTRRATATA
ncbi:MAG TPA: phasin family protein [Gemmatimonadaceae bacterium]